MSLTDLQHNDGGHDGGGPDGARPVDPALARSKWDLNDIGNARRLAALHGRHLRFVEDIGKGAWVWFDGRRWTADNGEGRAQAMAHDVIDALLQEHRALREADAEALAAVYGPKYTADMAKERCGLIYGWAMKSGNSDRLSGMLKQARGLTGPDGRFLMRARSDVFDANPLAFHCANGTLAFIQDMEWTCVFTPGHHASDNFMNMAQVAYDPDATAPIWTSRMERLHLDKTAVTAIQRIYGMCLTGWTSDQAFYVFQGKGGDGKSMTNSVIGGMMGDYFRAASPKTFLESKAAKSGSDHQSDIVRLKGDIRMVVCDEPKKGSTWDGERIKQVTGSRIVARAANASNEVTFKPAWKLIVECNPLPRAPSDDRGFRRRFKLYPWTQQFGVTAGLDDRPEHEVRPELEAEASGILNWMIRGALDWLNSFEVPEPELSRRALSSFWEASSSLGDWMEQCCDLSDPQAETGATALYEHFTKFCIAKGDKEETIINRTRFGLLLNEAQIYSIKNAAGRKVRIGIRIRPEAHHDAF